VEQSDEELVRLHLQGDKYAFCDLVDRYTQPVYNLAYRYTGDRMEAENIAQDTFLRVYQALPAARIDLPLKPWILRITANLCRDWARKKRPSLFNELSSDEEGQLPVIEKLTDDAPLLLDQVEAKEMAEWVRRAVMELPRPYRVVITLRYTEGLSYQEIATILGLPLNTVRTHLFRSKGLLSRALERWLEGEP
jgi:RNA polymerase sigma-70 factor (ECF subfamily)